jgi:DNA-binding NarL/FixJ family response regulator
MNPEEETTQAMNVRPPSTTVLLIDGHEADRDHWAQRLTDSLTDSVILEAETGAEGLAICRSQAVDCVLTELELPDMSGLELLARLVPRAFQPDIAIIVLSRFTLPEMEQIVRTNGGQAYLVKSQLSEKDLTKTINKAIAAVGPRKKMTYFKV